MKLFAHKTAGGIPISLYRIEIVEHDIRFGKIGSSLFYDILSNTTEYIDIFLMTYEATFLKSALKRKERKLDSYKTTAQFLKKHGNFIIPMDELERIHYNSPVSLDMYFILKNGKEYNFNTTIDELHTLEKMFANIPMTSKDYFF